MGVELKTVTVRWDPETVRMSDELQASFAALVENRSQLNRLAIRKLHADVMRDGTVAVIASYLQGLHCKTSASPLQPAAIPTRLFPKMAFKTGVVQ